MVPRTFWGLIRYGFLDPIIIITNMQLAKDAFAMECLENRELTELGGYILPTRGRADIILHKTENHLIDQIYLRKY